MDIRAARELLEISENATLEEIKHAYHRLARRWHPDVPTGDATQFILISTAFITLQEATQVDGDKKQIPAEVAEEIQIREQIDKSMDRLVKEFSTFRQHIEYNTKSYVRDVIFAATSSSEVQDAIKNKVARHLVETAEQIQAYIGRLTRRSAVANGEFLFELFDDIYRARRRYWLLTLYRNPVILSNVLATAVIFFCRYYPEISRSFPHLWDIANLWWPPTLFIFICGLYIGIEFLLMNPRRQFLPPRLSLVGLVV